MKKEINKRFMPVSEAILWSAVIMLRLLFSFVLYVVYFSQRRKARKGYVLL